MKNSKKFKTNWIEFIYSLSSSLIKENRFKNLPTKCDLLYFMSVEENYAAESR